MDNNIPTQPPTPQSPPAASTGGLPPTTTSTVTPPPVQPATPTPVVPVVAPQGSNKLVIGFIVGLIVIVLIIAGAYLFMRKQTPQTTQNSQVSSTETAENVPPPEPVIQTTPRPEDTVDALDRDLSALNVVDTESDFSSIDQDLEQL